MATLVSRTSGNFTTAATWALCSVAGELDSEAGSTNVAGTNLDSAAFVLEANQIDGFAVKLASDVGTGGTCTFTLRNSTTATDIFTVTINWADLYVNNASSGGRGWLFFSTGATHTPNGTDSYVIRCVRTTSGILLFTNGTANNWSRQVRRTATQAPAANDKLLIAGQYTGAGTSNRYTVTLDNTATTSFGPTVSGGPPQGITINAKGTLQLATPGSATNYYLKWKGLLEVYGDGELFLDNPTGTTGTVTACTLKNGTGRITNTTNATPIVVSSKTHGLSTGDVVRIYGNIGNTAANGTFQITVVDANSFSLQDSSGANVAGNGDHKWSGYISGLWMALPVCTSTSHGLTTGDIITIHEAGRGDTSGGTTGLNGCHRITTWGANKFILDASGTATIALTTAGTWIKRGPLPATSTCVLEMASVANVDSGIQVYNGGKFLSIGAPKTARTRIVESTIIGSDTTSMNSLVDTTNVANSVVTWKEGQKFDPAWTGSININGTSRTITGTVTTTSLTVTTNAGALTGVPAWKEATGANVTMKVDDTTGWVAGDKLVAISSARNAGPSIYTISSVDSATQVTLTAGSTGYHSGLNDVNGDVRSYVGNMTRNIDIRGVSTSLQGFVDLVSFSALVLHKDTEFYQLGSGTANKRGYSARSQTFGGHLQLLNCSIHDNIVASSHGYVSTANNAAHVNYPLIEGMVVANIAAGGTCVQPGANASSTAFTMSGCLVAGNLNANCVSTTSAGGFVMFDNVVTHAASNNYSFNLGATGASQMPVFYGNVSLGGSGGALNIQTGPVSGVFGDGTYGNKAIRSNGTSAGSSTVFFQASTSMSQKFAIDGYESFGCCGVPAAGAQVIVGAVVGGTLSNFKIESGANNVPAAGDVSVAICGLGADWTIDNMLSGQVTPNPTADVALWAANQSNSVRAVFRNCKFGSTNWMPATVVGTNGATGFSTAVSLNHNQVSGAFSGYKLHEAAYAVGGSSFSNIQTAKFESDAVVYRTAAPSLKITPSTLNSKIEIPIARIPVNSGSTITPTVYVRESQLASGDSANYNGAAAILILRADPSIGIAADVVLDTHSGTLGTWEAMSGTSASFTGTGVAVLEICCDGTAGFVSVDDFSCASVPTTQEYKFWAQDTLGVFVNGEPPAGGGGGGSVAFSPIGRFIG